ncbi:hypothetical protein [Flavobacterium sp. H122]|uniref:hypothetical protein n=1 Tax=Flavobacterium sp. H122 TaxID=2529860 RepID=UPI0010A9E4FE|nr:hypothetical protein [Flavobacterium sp. H122]
MKTMLGMLVFFFAVNSQAQKNNTQTEVKTTVTTVKDSEGEKKLVKSEVTREVQKVGVEAEMEKPNTKNIPMANNPVEVTKATAINSNGETRVVDVKKSAYFMNNGRKFQLQTENEGYRMLEGEGKFTGLLRKTSNNNFLYVSKNRHAYGYFDADGNFILETYNPKTDKMEIEKYTVEE